MSHFGSHQMGGRGKRGEMNDHRERGCPELFENPNSKYEIVMQDGVDFL